MPVDKNFIVVTAILGGLLVWAMVREPEKPPAQHTTYIMPPDDRPIYDEDSPMGEREDDPKLARDPTAAQIMQYMKDVASRILKYRAEMDAVFAGGGHRSTSDLEQNAPKWYKAFNDLYAWCTYTMDEFKGLQVRLNEEFGETSWVAASLNLIQIPAETRLMLDGYKSGTIYQQVYVHRLSVVRPQDSRPQTQQDYMRLNTNQQYNENADDYPMQNQDRDVFRGGGGKSDSMNLDKAASMVQTTTSNPARGSYGGTGSGHQVLTNNDAFNTLNPDGQLGGGNMASRASDTDMRDQDKISKSKDTASLLNSSGSQAFLRNKTA